MSVSERKNSWRDRLTIVLAVTLGAYFILLLFTRYAMQEYEPTMQNRVWIAALRTVIYVALGAVVLQVMRRRPWKKKIPLKDGSLCLILAGITIATRLALINLISYPISSDYKMYYDMAELYARTGFYNATDYIVVVAPNIVLYIILLGEVFKVFGCSLLTAQIVNMVFLAGCITMVYLLAREFFGKKVSFLAALGLCLSPSCLLFSLLPSTETVAFFPYLAGMVLFLRALRTEKTGRRLGIALICGLVLGLSNEIRSNALIALIALSLWAIIYKCRRSEYGFKRVMTLLLVVLASVYAVGQGTDVIRDEVFMGKKSNLQLGWTLYEGLDNVTAGGWRQENTDVLNATIAEYPLDQVQKVLLGKTIERVREYSWDTWLRLIIRKGVNIWIYNDYAYQTIIQTNEDSAIRLEEYRPQIVFIVNEAYKVLLMAVAVGMLGTVTRWRRGNMEGLLFLLLPLLFMVLWHSFATSIPRYHYYAMPNLVLIAWWCAGHMGSEERLGEWDGK